MGRRGVAFVLLMLMKILVTVKPSAREEKIEKISDTEFRVAVKEPPREGRANAGVIRALAEYFDVPVSAVHIVSGRTARKKIVEIG